MNKSIKNILFILLTVIALTGFMGEAKAKAVLTDDDASNIITDDDLNNGVTNYLKSNKNGVFSIYRVNCDDDGKNCYYGLSSLDSGVKMDKICTTYQNILIGTVCSTAGVQETTSGYGSNGATSQIYTTIKELRYIHEKYCDDSSDITGCKITYSTAVCSSAVSNFCESYSTCDDGYDGNNSFSYWWDNVEKESDLLLANDGAECKDKKGMANTSYMGELCTSINNPGKSLVDKYMKYLNISSSDTKSACVSRFQDECRNKYNETCNSYIEADCKNYDEIYSAYTTYTNNWGETPCGDSYTINENCSKWAQDKYDGEDETCARQICMDKTSDLKNTSYCFKYNKESVSASFEGVSYTASCYGSSCEGSSGTVNTNPLGTLSCSDIQDILNFFNRAYVTVEVLAFVILAIMSMADFMGVVINSDGTKDADKMKKAQKHLWTRIIIVVIIVLLPFIVKIMLNALGGSTCYIGL